MLHKEEEEEALQVAIRILILILILEIFIFGGRRGGGGWDHLPPFKLFIEQ